MKTAKLINKTGLKLNEINISNKYSELPTQFFTKIVPTPLNEPYLVCSSDKSSELININSEEIKEKYFIDVFSGNTIFPKSVPLAAVYSGHQFGVWAGQLGDGRAILLGNTNTYSTKSGMIELQLKGSGKTPYSRMGDGRAVLRSSIREFLCSEAMNALNIPSSHALCVIGSDELVMRESFEKIAVITRLCENFIRFGSFEHWFYSNKKNELKTLADYVINNNFPEFKNIKNPYSTLLRNVTKLTARLVSNWQAIGFMHGVLNTDNMSILGKTIDYGPFGFMETYNPNHICNSSDYTGLYSYKMQPKICEWNCYALGQALLPLIGDIEEVKDALSSFKNYFSKNINFLFSLKLGFINEKENDQVFIENLLNILYENQIDFSIFFRRLSNLELNNPINDRELSIMFKNQQVFNDWAVSYRSRLKWENSNDILRKKRMNQVNPKFILRNYLAENAIKKAEKKDFTEIARLNKILQSPFDEQPENQDYSLPSPEWAKNLKISCSS